MENYSKICVIGLGYVGLPLAVEFSKKFNLIGYDKNKLRVNQLKKGLDVNSQLKKQDIKQKKLKLTYRKSEIKDCDIYIITVPTPVSKNKKPDLNPLKDATLTVAQNLSKGNIVILESTVYPGLTEEFLVQILESKTDLKLNKHFYVGYSPERISPGDKLRTLKNVKKVVSGSNQYSSRIIFNLYKKIINAGVYLAPSIKVAESSKILENVQRDINISLMNEASLIFDKLKIDTYEVLKAASTKWNFLKFTPGLVGGHCISVDPYYLKYKAEKAGYKPSIISSGRKVNENMTKIISNKIRLFFKRRKNNNKIRIGIMGLTFKENCPDTRNSQIFKLINLLKKKRFDIEITDPLLKISEIPKPFKKFFVNKFSKKKDCLVLATPHKEFLKYKKNYYENNLNDNSMIFDVQKVLKLNLSKKISLYSF